MALRGRSPHAVGSRRSGDVVTNGTTGRGGPLAQFLGGLLDQLICAKRGELERESQAVPHLLAEVFGPTVC